MTRDGRELLGEGPGAAPRRSGQNGCAALDSLEGTEKDVERAWAAEIQERASQRLERVSSRVPTGALLSTE
jgi:hypothetical protein